MTGDRAAGSPWPSRVLALLLSLAILAALVSRVPVSEVWADLRTIGPWPVAVTVLVALIDGIWVDVDKLRRILRHLGHAWSFWEVGALAIPALALGALMPAQGEEVWKARQMQVRLGTSFGEALGIVALDRGINLMSHGVLGIGGLLALWWDLEGGGHLLLPLICAYGAGLGVIWLAARVARLGTEHAGIWTSLSGALRSTSGPFQAGMLAYACLANLALSGGLWWVGRAAGAHWTLASALAWRAGSVIASKVPITVGGLGVREGVLVVGLAGWTSSSAAVAAGLIFGLTTALAPPLVALGFWSWFQDSMDQMLRDLARGLRVIRRSSGKARRPSGMALSGTGSPSEACKNAECQEPHQHADPDQSPTVSTDPGQDRVR